MGGFLPPALPNFSRSKKIVLVDVETFFFSIGNFDLLPNYSTLEKKKIKNASKKCLSLSPKMEIHFWSDFSSELILSFFINLKIWLLLKNCSKKKKATFFSSWLQWCEKLLPIIVNPIKFIMFIYEKKVV